MTTESESHQQYRQRDWRCQGSAVWTSKDGRTAADHRCTMTKFHWGQCICWCEIRFKPDVPQPKQHTMWPDWLYEVVTNNGS